MMKTDASTTRTTPTTPSPPRAAQEPRARQWADSTLEKYAQSDLLERHEGEPIYFHSARCPSFCDYACNGERGAEIARQIEKREAKMRALLDRSYALRPCGHCQPLSRESATFFRSDIRCPGCGTSPYRRVQKQKRFATGGTK